MRNAHRNRLSQRHYADELYAQFGQCVLFNIVGVHSGSTANESELIVDQSKCWSRFAQTVRDAVLAANATVCYRK